MFTSITGKITSLKAWVYSISQDQASVRSLRFAIGVTIGVALAYGINWPLSFLLPILAAVILALPMPMPSLKAGLINMKHTLQAFAIGLVFSEFFLKFPIAYLLMLSLVLFHLYYYLNRGGSFWFTLISLVAILLLPMLPTNGNGLAFGFSLGFIFSGWLTVLLVWLAHLLVPDPQFTVFPQRPPYQRVYSPVAAKTALKSTLVIFPLASVLIIFSMTDYILVMINAAIFILKPELSAGKEAGKNALVSTLLGGLFAMVFYWLIVVVPEFHFFIILMFLTTLVFAVNIFFTNKYSVYFGAAFVPLLILLNSSMAVGASFTMLFITRILLIALTTVYIIFALRLLDSYWPNKTVN